MSSPNRSVVANPWNPWAMSGVMPAAISIDIRQIFQGQSSVEDWICLEGKPISRFKGLVTCLSQKSSRVDIQSTYYIENKNILTCEASLMASSSGCSLEDCRFNQVDFQRVRMLINVPLKGEAHSRPS